MEGRLLEKSAE